MSSPSPGEYQQVLWCLLSSLYRKHKDPSTQDQWNWIYSGSTFSTGHPVWPNNTNKKGKELMPLGKYLDLSPPPYLTASKTSWGYSIFLPFWKLPLWSSHWRYPPEKLHSAEWGTTSNLSCLLFSPYYYCFPQNGLFSKSERGMIDPGLCFIRQKQLVKIQNNLCWCAHCILSSMNFLLLYEEYPIPSGFS